MKDNFPTSENFHSKMTPPPRWKSHVNRLFLITGVFALFLILCTAPAVADTHEHDHGIAGDWTPISSEDDLRGISTSGNYYLSEDIVLTIGEWQIPYGKTINLCLNSHVIKQTAYEEAVINIGSGSTLNLYDCGNTIHYFNKDSDTGLWTMIENEDISDYFVIGGVITGGSSDYEAGRYAIYDGGGVYCLGTFTMHGGNIVGNKARYNGGGVYCNNVFTMTGGKIVGNTAGSQGAGVYCYGFTMSGGSIEGNKAADYDGAGGVYVGYSGDFTMSGDAKIADNEGGKAGGVYIYSGDFTMESGEITGNKATDSEGAGGVYVGYSGDFTMESGEITGNKATGYNSAGGVYMDSYDGTFTMSGDAKIAENEGEEAGGVYVKSGDFTMSGDAKIAENEGEKAGGVYIYSGDFTMSGDAKIAENEGYKAGGVYMDYDSGDFIMTGGEITGNTATGSEGAGGVYMDSYDGTFTMSGDAKIAENEGEKAGGVYIGGSTFTMESGEITGNTATDSYSAGGVYCENSGDFTMSGDAKIANNEGDYAGGVYFCGSTFTMSGDAKIAENEGEKAGGVYIGGSTFTMEGGEITGNTAESYGGGVHNQGTFMMNGGEITGNTAEYGAGVCGDEYGGTFTMNGGEITGNSAESRGGGVHISGAIFNLNGGSITGNTAGENGAGVYVGNYHMQTEFTVSGNPKILGNTITGGDASNLYLYNEYDLVIKIDSEVGLTLGADIGIMMTTSFLRGDHAADLTEEGCVEEEWMEYFHIDKPEEQHLVYDAENKKIMIALGPKPVPTPPGNGDLNVTYNNLQRYVVVIPGDMDFGALHTLRNEVNVTEMWLEIEPVKKQLIVSVKSANEFKMVQGEPASSFIPYTMSILGGATFTGDDFNEILRAPADTPKIQPEGYFKKSELNYEVTQEAIDAAKFAGEHKDTLTFKVEVKNASA